MATIGTPRLWLALATALLLVALGAVAVRAVSDSKPAPADRPRIVCTTRMISDVVERIAGDHVQVTTLMGPGVDPHLYHPTRDDTRALLSADLIFFNGLHLEGKMTHLLEDAARTRPVFAVTDGLAALADDAGAPDPHVWMDPTLWSHTIDVVRDRLTEALPAHTAELAERAAALRAEFDALHAYSLRILHAVPEPQRVLVTAHDAFGYFGKRYGYDVLGIQGISTESEAGLKDLDNIIDTLVTRNVPAVFIESTVPPRNVRALLAGAQARGQAITLGGTLFSDAAGPAGTYEGTYLGMIDHNVTTIARALGVDAPVGGMQGKLALPTP